MPDNQKSALTDWPGDTASLIAEIKRRAGVGTDQDLARHLGVAQSTVAHWRARSRIPEATLLRIERLMAAGSGFGGREVAATMVALRLPEFWFQRNAAEGLKAGRAVLYRHIAANFPALLHTISEQLRAYERETGQTALDLAPQLLADDAFLGHLVDEARSRLGLRG
jgi:hypothetical protein